MTLKNIDNYDITIYNRQKINSESDLIEEKTTGRVYVRNGKTYIIYKNSSEAEDYSTVIVSESSITIKRKGTIKTNMLYVLGKRTHFAYSLPYGTINVEAETKLAENSITEFGGELHLIYDLFIQEEKYCNDLRIQATKRG